VQRLGTPLIARPSGVRFVPGRCGKPQHASDAAGVVTRVEQLQSEYWLVEFQADRSVYKSRPGQFVMIRPAAQRYQLRRPFTLYRTRAGHGQVVFRVTGAGTEALAAMSIGDTVEVLGPLGNGFHLDPATEVVIVIGRGVGIASLNKLALDSAATAQTVVLLSARRPDLLLATPEFQQAGAVVLAVDDASGTSDTAQVEQLLTPYFQHARAQAFVCGSARLIQLAARLGAAYGVEVQAALEAPMACGIGTCHACPVGELDATEGPLVCLDGPVFAALPA
jgi:dihydroorotate dehydrogenase electron transfer subunit